MRGTTSYQCSLGLVYLPESLIWSFLGFPLSSPAVLFTTLHWWLKKVQSVFHHHATQVLSSNTVSPSSPIWPHFLFIFKVMTESPSSLWWKDVSFTSGVLHPMITKFSGSYSIQRLSSKKKTRNLLSPLGSSGLLLLPPGGSLNAGIALACWQESHSYLVLSVMWPLISGNSGASADPVVHWTKMLQGLGAVAASSGWRPGWGSPTLQVLSWTAVIPCQCGPGIPALLLLG